MSKMFNAKFQRKIQKKTNTMNSKKTKPIPKIYGYNKQMTKEDILQTAQQLKTVNNREGNPNLGNRAREDGIFVSFKFDQLIPNYAAGNFNGLTVLAKTKTKSPQKKKRT